MKVEKLFLKYIKHYKEDYELTVKYLQGEREKNTNKFSSLKKSTVVNRKIYEMPETLYSILLANLSREDLIKMKDGEDGKDFARWFAKRFPEFAAGTHI